MIEGKSLRTLAQSERPEGLAFDHEQILDTAVRRIRGQIDYKPIAFDLVPDTFTIAQSFARFTRR